MSVKEWLGSMIRAKAAPPTALSLREPDGWPRSEVWSGETVSGESALALSAVWGCVNLLAGTIASLPLMVYRRKGDDRVALAVYRPEAFVTGALAVSP